MLFDARHFNIGELIDPGAELVLFADQCAKTVEVEHLVYLTSKLVYFAQMRIDQVRFPFLQDRQPLLLLVLQGGLQAELEEVLDLRKAICLFRLDLFPVGHYFITSLLECLIRLVQCFHQGLQLCLPLLKDHFGNLFTMAIMASFPIKETFGTDSHLTVITIVNFLKAIVFTAQVFPLKYRSCNHLLKLAHSYKFTATLTAFSAASRGSKLAQAGCTHDTRAFRAYFDNSVFWCNW